MRRKNNHDVPGQGQGQGQGQGGRSGVTAATGVGATGGGETGGVTAATLPVFLFPSELLFFSEQRRCHRRVLTLYNPYSFTLDYKMLCTSPSLYRVLEAEGSVRAKSCVDLVVRHLDVSPANCGRRDRFRLEVRGGGQRGGREVWAELRRGEEGGGEGEEEEERKRRRPGGQQQRALQLPVHTAVRPSVSQWLLCVLLALLCVAVLMLPLHTDSGSMVPRCLHVSTNQKLACAYTLGLLTMVFLR
ncbi:motile sperm domain-containing protein 1-like [Sander lucioperca]|uniref:Motile sperm domain-containing protein 1-like n=1 Tax=Sander lucioperca TaxID=283035 RepID=A0A8C9ZRX9_SANLU|nr:motile sperm domain-containing protein 1-like [Sander lucioperca]XP_031169632.1 motile sperm domain-containing protein 1-like [Sander lucioperca]XP_031169633.1 motile sperm domain-containing protein 1-like [Sander lucioperca]XP_031169634.1 motile sperm domain-containing protein 1-like [Sander lucioperca]XP_031169635.1 motile sperm domain-containing protein 1-like [Sander lucioperca]